MNEIKIENPKVFISYAWGSKEYQEKVLSFATDLMEDGIDVVIDKWSMKEGHDTYAFMEQSVNDQSVTNVLLLLDPQYEKKANERSGGVGTETQIISPEIYNKVKQEKFLPVIFERKEDGSIPKPAYLKRLLHFDLSIDERFDEEYQRLVQSLYGVEIYKKPELGNRPAWVGTAVSTVSTKTRISYNALKGDLPKKIKVEKFEKFLSEIKDKILAFNERESIGNITLEKYLELYSETTPIRDEFLQLIRNVSYVDAGEKLIAGKLEEIESELEQKGGYINDIQKTLLHEMFLYVIAIYYKTRNYTAISYTLTKSYFALSYFKCEPQRFSVFYHYDENLENAVKKRDEKNYYSGTAQYWIENINVEICSKNDFIFADVLCYNASVFGSNCIKDWGWFPLTYSYGGYDNRLMRIFSGKLKSKEHLEIAACIFGYDNIEEFKKKFASVEDEFQKGKIEPVSHSRAFERAPLLCMYIKCTELGIIK